MTPQHIFIIAAFGLALAFGLIFWCGWVARDGQVRDAREEARLAESFAESARKSAEQWEANSDSWAARAVDAESKLDAYSKQLEISSARIFALESKPVADISGPSASALCVPAASKPSISRARGARGRFIKSS